MRTASAALTAKLFWNSKSLHGSVKKCMLTSYIQVVSHLLENYATYDIITEADTEIELFSQPTNTSLSQYANAL